MNARSGDPLSGEAANIAVVLRFFADLTRADLSADQRLALIAEDAVWYAPGRGLISGWLPKRERMARSALLAPFLADFAMTVDAAGAMARDDQVAIETTSVAQNRQTGEAYANRYHWRFTVRDGRITELREYMDSQHFDDVFGAVARPSDSQ